MKRLIKPTTGFIIGYTAFIYGKRIYDTLKLQRDVIDHLNIENDRLKKEYFKKLKNNTKKFKNAKNSKI